MYSRSLLRYRITFVVNFTDSEVVHLSSTMKALWTIKTYWKYKRIIQFDKHWLPCGAVDVLGGSPSQSSQWYLMRLEKRWTLEDKLYRGSCYLILEIYEASWYFWSITWTSWYWRVGLGWSSMWLYNIAKFGCYLDTPSSWAQRNNKPLIIQHRWLQSLVRFPIYQSTLLILFYNKICTIRENWEVPSNMVLNIMG